MAVSSATLEALEFPKLLAVLSPLAATDLGRERLSGLRPCPEEEELRQRRQRFEEASRLLQGGRLVPSFEESFAAVLERLVSGRPPVHGRDLVLLASLLKAAGEARERILEVDPPCPALGDDAGALPDLTELQQRIHRCLDRRGEVKEGASPALRRFRTRIQGLRDGLYKNLKSYVHDHRDDLSDETIPLRGGRLVLSLQSGSRGRLQGLTHGRSGTGKSFYFEPLQVVESNNQLQQAVEDEAAEKLRILNELVAEAAGSLEALRAQAAFVARLDLLQAAHRFGELCGGRLAEIGPRHELKLVDARHPLLDPRLADLRLEALGQAGHQGEAVPLTLELSAGRRLLVVTGPNAGGKTVSLKTCGLLALASLCGLPVPAGAGSRIPFLTNIVATVGDEQDLLTDRSTFSGRLLRLKEAWEEAGEDSLILLDELGSGTDPTEGAALAVSLLEELLERSSLALMTSHLIQVASAAMELEGASCAAMEFDPQSGSPTFRLVPGPPGGSEALALARRLGLPKPWLDRAESRLGPEHRDLRRLLAEVEALRRDLREERQALATEIADAVTLRERLAGQEEALRQERKDLSKNLRRQLEDFRRETLQRLRQEEEKLREKAAEGRRKGSAGTSLKGAAAKATSELFEEAPRFEADEEEEGDGPLEVGGTVRHRTFGWQGTLEKLERGKAEVSVRGKRLRCKEEEIFAVREEGSSTKRRPKTTVSTSRSTGDDASETAPRELNLIGQRVEPALGELDGFLDRALLASLPEVRVIHGHGSGRLKQAVRQHLRTHRAVADFRPGGEREGRDGATVVQLAC